MEEKIEDIFVKYRSCTKDIIEAVEKDQFELLKSKLDERKDILDRITSGIYKKAEIKYLYEKFEVLNLEKKAQDVMNKSTVKLRKKISSITRNKHAASAYGNVGNGAAIFSKKI